MVWRLPTLTQNFLFSIVRIDPNGAAERAGLRLGDILLEVNGIYVGNLHHKRVVGILRKCSQGVRLLVRPTLRSIVFQLAPNFSRDLLGFSLMQKGKSFLHVCSLEEDGMASTAGLELGDQLWEINGRNVRSKTKEFTETLLEKVCAGEAACLRLVVLSTLRHVTLQGQMLGINITGERPPRIGNVDNDSIAERAGLRPGDVIWAVNGRNVLKATHSQVVNSIRACTTRVVLSVPLT